MKQLFEHIKQSVYGPVYYQELLTRSLSFSWKYYSALALSLTLFLTIVSSIPLVPRVHQFVRDFPEKFFAYYPDQLEIQISKGIVAANVAEPYFLPLPLALKEASMSPENSMAGSLVVIDTMTPFSLEQFHQYDALVWLGKDQVAFVENESGVRVEPIDKQLDLIVNEGMLRSIEQKLQPLYGFVTPIVVVAIFLGLVFAFGLNFVYLVFGAALIFVFGRVIGEKWSYKMAYRIGLHAITLPLLLSVVFSLLNLPFFNVPYLYSAIMLAVVYVNFKKVPTPSSVETPVA